MRRDLAAVVPLLVFVAVSGCASSQADPSFGPYRSLVEVVAELEFHRDADLYRFDAPTDVTGENLYRASLARLQNFDALVTDPRFDDSIAFAMAQARERLLDFDAAADLYGRVAAAPTPLGTCAAELLPLTRQLRDLTRPVESEGQLTPDAIVAELEVRRGAMLDLLEASVDDPRSSLVEVVVERLDVRRREFQWRVRAVMNDGTGRALDFASAVVELHPESARVHEHRLRLADMYAELARGYASSIDPGDYEFDATRFRNMVQAASALYTEVATVDGRPERQEARAGLASMESLVRRVRGSTP